MSQKKAFIVDLPRKKYKMGDRAITLAGFNNWKKALSYIHTL